MTLERDPQGDHEQDVLEPDAPASADVPGEGADRQGDPDPGEDAAGQSERARK